MEAQLVAVDEEGSIKDAYVLDISWRSIKEAFLSPRGREMMADSLAVDSLAAVAEVPLSTDPHDPMYYLQQIPRTEEDYRLSDSLWIDAMVSLFFMSTGEMEEEFG